MKRIRLAAVAIAIVIIGDISKAGQITYSLQNYPADQAGSTLTGSVTTDGNLGTLAAADIVAWTWTVTPPVGAAFTQSSGAGIPLTVENLVATGTQLLLPSFQSDNSLFELGTVDSASGQLEYRRDRDHAGAWVYAAEPSLPGSGFWLQDSPSMGGTDPWVIGVATASVPEPSGIVLVTFGITGLLLARTWRASSRKQYNC